jgi:hypothetical protein
MKLKRIVMAIQFACRVIGNEWRQNNSRKP